MVAPVAAAAVAAAVWAVAEAERPSARAGKFLLAEVPTFLVVADI